MKSKSVRMLRDPVVHTAVPKTVRLVNRSVLLEMIRLHQPISRAQLSTVTGMVRSNVSAVVDGLLTDGLVTERPGVPNGRGRVPLLLELNDNGYLIFGVNLRSAETTVALAGLSGHHRDDCTFKSPSNPREFVVCLKDSISSLARRNGIPLRRVRRIGISAPGLADSGSGEILTLPFFPEYSQFPLAPEIQKATGIATVVENDCNLAAMALIWDAESKDDSLADFVLVDAGDVGLGAGIVLNRQLYRGRDKRFAAEFGHMVIDPGGGKCNCGRYGCLELFATDQATWQRVTGDTKFDRVGFERLVDDAEAGDAAAIEAFRQTERYLALAIGNIGAALNPQAIILSGRITRVPGSVKRIQASAGAFPFTVDVRAARLTSDELFLRGAVCLAAENIFSRPSLGERM